MAGDTDAGVQLVESLDDVVTEIVDDLYLAHFGQQKDDPMLTREQALDLARQGRRQRTHRTAAARPAPGFEPAVRVDFAKAVCAELETRKRKLGILHYDDLLSRLANALEADDSPARARMQRRWSIVMVDEFQDTDPVQWQVIDRAFSGHATVILIGDPKQAIYAFRGGDIVTYLHAAAPPVSERRWTPTGAATSRSSTACRRCRDAATRRRDIVVREVEAHHQVTAWPARRTTNRSGCAW